MPKCKTYEGNYWPILTEVYLLDLKKLLLACVYPLFSADSFLRVGGNVLSLNGGEEMMKKVYYSQCLFS